jgi:hypothetical protein
MNYSVAGDDLLITDADHKLRWRGQPEQRAVEWATALRFADDGLALYHYYRPDHPYGEFRNLVRVRPDGSIVWRAELPGSDDKYVNAKLAAEGRLSAYSYRGYEVEIDLDTGRIVSKRFSK